MIAIDAQTAEPCAVPAESWGPHDDADPARWPFTVDEEPLHDNAIIWRSRATRTAARLPHVRLHDLRHSYAAGLIAAGCDVVTVQRALGHSAATATLNTYSHLWPTAEDRTRKATAGLMRQAIGGHAAPERPGDDRM